ncbi:MAG TPA: cell division protein SepF [Bacillales bacterium]|nr:cell division protein SepF [Bacillales bacterium]
MGLKSKFMRYFELDENSEFREQAEVERESYRTRNRHEKVVSLKSAKKHSQMVLREPQTFAEVQNMADELKNHRAVVMNFQRASSSEAKRMVDFLSGTVYALDGNMQKLGPNTFLCTPDNVDVAGAISEFGSAEER